MTQAHEALADMLMKSDENSDSRIARLAADRIHDVLTAAGYAIVPVEPTDKMLGDGWIQMQMPSGGTKKLADIFRAMIAAAQGNQ